MSDRYLLHKPSGVVHIWQGVWANNPDFEEVADVKGTPLKPALEGEFEEVVEPKPKAKKAKKAAAPVVEDEVPAGNPEVQAPDLDALLADLDDSALSADASRGL